MTHDEARISLGALALGALDDVEAGEVREHLATCAHCQEEYEELRGIPALLGLLSVAEVESGPTVATEAGANRLLAAVVAERKTKDRRRMASTFAGALALAASAAVIGFVVAEGAAEEVEEPDFTLANTDQASGVWAEVNLDKVGWGTRIELHLTGVEPGETCRLVAVSSTSEEVASTWQVPESDYISIPGAVGTQPDQIIRFDVISSDNVVLVSIPL